jgi:MOSC domain-containing protein YiiM
VTYLATRALEEGLEEVRRAPTGVGRLELIVRRPAVDERQVVRRAVLDLEAGLVGDNWLTKGSKSSPDRLASPDKQVTVTNARAIALVAGGEHANWALAGDQLYVDMDISVASLPAGSLLRIAKVVLEVSEAPHNGCAKFAARFGQEAVRFFNSKEGKALRLRGLNARILVPGTVHVGDVVQSEPPAASYSSSGSAGGS